MPVIIMQSMNYNNRLTNGPKNVCPISYQKVLKFNHSFRKKDTNNRHNLCTIHAQAPVMLKSQKNAEFALVDIIDHEVIQ